MTYSRDRAGRLTSETSAGPAVPASNRRYGYTKLGQLCFDTPTIDTTSTCAAPGVGATPYAYDTADTTVRTAANSKQKYNTADQLCWSVAAGSPPDACGTVPSARVPSGRRQLRWFAKGTSLAAKGPRYATFVVKPIRWVVAEPAATAAIRNLFGQNGISGINVSG